MIDVDDIMDITLAGMYLCFGILLLIITLPITIPCWCVGYLLEKYIE